MLQSKTGTHHQPMSMPLDLSTACSNIKKSITVDTTTGENNENIWSSKSVTNEMIKNETTKLSQESKSSAPDFDEVLSSISADDEMFDLQKIRDKIDAMKLTAEDDFERAMADQASFDDLDPPQYVVYANDYSEELQFYLEM